MTAIDRVIVVIPAQNEEVALPACLASLRHAIERAPDHLAVDLVVAVNSSDDDTVAVARAASAHVIELVAANVGAARAAGATWALRHQRSTADRLWLATTDADSRVPRHWIREQVRLADAGADATVGMVRLTARDAARHTRWVQQYEMTAQRGPVHGHVHGANLGVRGTTYDAVGGFAAMASHEDTDLVDRLRAHGATIAWPDLRVITSARHRGAHSPGVGADLAASLEIAPGA